MDTKLKKILTLYVIFIFTISSFVTPFPQFDINNNNNNNNNIQEIIGPNSHSSKKAEFPKVALNTEDSRTLGELADLYNLSIGSLAAAYQMNDPLLTKTIIEEYNTIVLGWDAMWSNIHPQRDVYRFDEMDNMVRIAKKSNKTIICYGYILWMMGYPDWLASDDPSGSINQLSNFSSSELLEILDEHIETVVGRYKDDIDYWYIGNELIDTPYYWGPPYTYDNYTAEMQDTFWYDIIGPDYISYVFNKAREVAPNMKLFLNEGIGHGFSQELSESRFNFFYDLVTNLLSENVPIDGIGLQCWTEEDLTGFYPPPSPYNWTFNEECLKAFTDLGLEVHMSEVGVRTKYPLTQAKLQHQAELYQTLINLSLSNENITAFIPFEISDKNVPWVAEEETWFPFNHDVEKTPSYYALKHRLQGNTDLYQHDFSNPNINPPINIPLDYDWASEPPINIQYEVLTANYNNLESWPIIKNTQVCATLSESDKFWVNISKFPQDEVTWNQLNYLDIDISGDSFNGIYEGDYSFWDREHFIRDVWYPGTPQWIRKTIPEDSRISWDDEQLVLELTSYQWLSDPDLEIINNNTHFGYRAQNENFSISNIMNKDTGILEYYHYQGNGNPGTLLLDFEFSITTLDQTNTEPTNTEPTNTDNPSDDSFPGFMWHSLLISIVIGVMICFGRRKKR